MRSKPEIRRPEFRWNFVGLPWRRRAACSPGSCVARWAKYGKLRCAATACSTSTPRSTRIAVGRRSDEVIRHAPYTMSHEYLVIFQYHEPEPLQLFERGVIEDYESTTGVFITAASEEEALNWCKAIAQALLCHCNDDRSLDWTRFGHSCWIEPDPGKSTWGHCLDFFSARAGRRNAGRRRNEYGRVHALAE